MQKRAGILFISLKSKRVFLKMEESKWTVPTFLRNSTVLDDSTDLIQSFGISNFKLMPVELYLSKDQGFEYSTYICLVPEDFIPSDSTTFCWASLNALPKGLHNGLKVTLSNQIILGKIDVIIQMSEQNDQY